MLPCACNDSGRPVLEWPNKVVVADLLPQATQIVREGLADQDPVIRFHAIEVVATTRRIKLMPEVQRRLKDDFFPVRFAAALAVGDLEYALAERSVRRLLRDEDENVRVAAAYAMGKLGSPESFEIIREAIAAPDLKVRANAALALGKTGNKNALGSLYVALRRPDSDDKVRFQAAESIAMLGDERIYPKLWTMLLSTFADVRITGVRAMGALGNARARNALITMLDDGLLEVRLAAAEHLGRLGDNTGEPVVLDVFAKNLTAGLAPDALERARVFTALAIGGIGTDRLAAFLPRLLRDGSKAVRLAAAKAVFEYQMRSASPEKFSI